LHSKQTFWNDIEDKGRWQRAVLRCIWDRSESLSKDCLAAIRHQCSVYRNLIASAEVDAIFLPLLPGSTTFEDHPALKHLKPQCPNMSFYQTSIRFHARSDLATQQRFPCPCATSTIVHRPHGPKACSCTSPQMLKDPRDQRRRFENTFLNIQNQMNRECNSNLNFFECEYPTNLNLLPYIFCVRVAAFQHNVWPEAILSGAHDRHQ